MICKSNSLSLSHLLLGKSPSSLLTSTTTFSTNALSEKSNFQNASSSFKTCFFVFFPV